MLIISASPSHSPCIPQPLRVLQSLSLNPSPSCQVPTATRVGARGTLSALSRERACTAPAAVARQQVSRSSHQQPARPLRARPPLPRLSPRAPVGC
jgi:hypothetical protein